MGSLLKFLPLVLTTVLHTLIFKLPTSTVNIWARWHSRAHAPREVGLWFESNSIPLLNARSLFTQQRMGTWWQHWGDKGGEERNWPPYLTCRWLRISYLANRHSPTYESYGTAFTLTVSVSSCPFLFTLYVEIILN